MKFYDVTSWSYVNLDDPMKNPPFDSLVWGSLRLAPIILFLFPLGGVICHCSVFVNFHLSSLLAIKIKIKKKLLKLDDIL